jgi:hypothetical protein
MSATMQAPQCNAMLASVKSFIEKKKQTNKKYKTKDPQKPINVMHET